MCQQKQNTIFHGITYGTYNNDLLACPYNLLTTNKSNLFFELYYAMLTLNLYYRVCMSVKIANIVINTDLVAFYDQ